MTAVPYLVVGIDYELFFGRQHGSVGRCLLEPTRHLVDILERHNARLTVFADAGYLRKLADCADQSAQRDHGEVVSQLRELVARGHDVQLHVHPHWEDSTYNAGQWQIVTNRYRLDDFDLGQRQQLVSGYKAHLDDIADRPCIAYRAGGWCMQPFTEISDALYSNGIWLDSTVFAEGVSEDSQRGFDFRGSPQQSWWRFSDDPLCVDPAGRFVELPIGSEVVGPTFFWASEIRKRLQRSEHASFGDGGALRADWRYYANRLTQRSIAPASIDGTKASLIRRHYDRVTRGGGQVVNLMGHPKALTPYSLETLDSALTGLSFEGITIRDLGSVIGKPDGDW